MKLGWPVILGALLLVGGCRTKTRAPIQVRAAQPDGPSVEFQFSPVSALAEYVEVPGEGAELTLTFTSYPRQCSRFVAPPTENDSMVSVVVTFPLNTKPAVATYLWAGQNARAAGAEPPEPAPLLEQPFAQPLVRQGRRSFVMQPGGGLRVTDLALERDGVIRGILAFEFRGDARHPASAVKGSFDAQLCRFKTLAET